MIFPPNYGFHQCKPPGLSKESNLSFFLETVLCPSSAQSKHAEMINQIVPVALCFCLAANSPILLAFCPMAWLIASVRHQTFERLCPDKWSENYGAFKHLLVT